MGFERVRESSSGAGVHSHDKAGSPQSYRAHGRRIAVWSHVGEGVQGGGYPSCGHREERGVLKTIGAKFVVNSFLPFSCESHRGHSRGRCDGQRYSRGSQLYTDQVHSAYRPAMARTVYKYGGLDKRNSEFLPSVGVGNWLVMLTRSESQSASPNSSSMYQCFSRFPRRLQSASRSVAILCTSAAEPRGDR